MENRAKRTEMTHTTESLMALADVYAKANRAEANVLEQGSSEEFADAVAEKEQVREAIRAALTEALAFRPDWADFENGRECGRLEAIDTSQERVEKSGGNVRVPVAITRDDTEHGVYYYRASEVDALMAAQPNIQNYPEKDISAQPKGLFVDLIEAQGPEFVAEMAKIGCIGHDCAECKDRAAQPTIKESLTVPDALAKWARSPELEQSKWHEGYEAARAWVHVQMTSWQPEHATQPVREPLPTKWAEFLHYPGCWDTAAYPTLESAVHEALAWSGCAECKPRLPMHKKNGIGVGE
jgi:bacterioferritin-associated ferredoxin